MATRKKGIPVNREKLKEQIRIRGLTHAEVSRQIGRADNFISCIVSERGGLIGKDTAIMLDKLFNIKLEDYQLEQETHEEPQKETGGLDYEELYKVIYSAVYEAVKKAWSE